jgi:hypothetical protein
MNAKDQKLYLDILQGCAAIHADGAAARAEAKERFEAVVKVRRLERAERTIKLTRLVGGVGLIAAVVWCREQEGFWHLIGFATTMVLGILAVLDQGQEPSHKS